MPPVLPGRHALPAAEGTDKGVLVGEAQLLGNLRDAQAPLLQGLAGHFLGYNTVFMWAWKYREPVLDLFEMITGNRNSYAMFKVGGVRRDIENSKIPAIEKVLALVKKKQPPPLPPAALHLLPAGSRGAFFLLR